MSSDTTTTATISSELVGDPETRDRILNSAIACFSQYGNDKTTLADVAKVAGISRQTIYRYFPDRRRLLEAVQDFEDSRLRSEITQIGNQSGSLEQFLTNLILNRLDLFRRYHTRQHLLEHDRGLMHSMFLSLDHNLDVYREVVTPQLRAARRRGELRKNIDLDQAAEWIAISLSSLFRLTTAQTFNLDDPAETSSFFVQYLCHGLTETSGAPRPAR